MSLLDKLLKTIKETRVAKGTTVVAIDGHGGAGKSSLARSVLAAVPDSTHIEYDWFHLPRRRVTPEERFDNERLIKEVLKPFRLGSKSVVFQQYNWGYLSGAEDGFASTPIHLSLGTVLLIEGCNTLNRVLDEYYNVRVWLDTTPEESWRRGIKRDIEEYKLEPERVRVAWAEWAKWEMQSLAVDDRRKRADFLL